MKPLAKKISETASLTGSFLLRSGQVSDRYFDKYQFESDPILLREIAVELNNLLPKNVELIAGLELGAIPLATMVSQISGLPTVFVRKKAKEYGTNKLAEGVSVGGKRVVVIEDVITSGGQVVESVSELRAIGALISDVICVIDRESGGEELLSTHDLKMQPLFKMSDLEAI